MLWQIFGKRKKRGYERAEGKKGGFFFFPIVLPVNRCIQFFLIMLFFIVYHWGFSVPDYEGGEGTWWSAVTVWGIH